MKQHARAILCEVLFLSLVFSSIVFAQIESMPPGYKHPGEGILIERIMVLEKPKAKPKKASQLLPPKKGFVMGNAVFLSDPRIHAR